MMTNRLLLNRRSFCFAGASLLGLTGLPAWAKREDVPNPVKLGLVKSLFREIPAGLVLLGLQPFKTYLDAEMEVNSKLVAAGDPFELAEDLKKGELHLGVFHGTEFAWAKQRYDKLKPLFIAVNGQPSLTTHLLVRKESKYRTLADLQGRVLIIPGRTREHCWLFLERRCVKPGTKPQSFYSKLFRIPSVIEALDMVQSGQATAVLADGADWAAYQQEQPRKAANLRPLLSSEPLPCALLASWDGVLAPKLVEKFTMGMLNAHKSEKGRELLKVMRITGFQAVPEDFDKQLEAAAKAYPPPAKG
ncbi:MAG: PhnD/SsuA/transferrin family substrate-binding protein [Gemmataceae bacterium]